MSILQKEAKDITAADIEQMLNKGLRSKFTVQVLVGEQTPKVQYPKDPKKLYIENKAEARIMYDFIRFVTSLPNAIGMAANQVAINGIQLLRPYFIARPKGKWGMYICPLISKYKGDPKEEIEECLSWPGQRVLATRYPSIDAMWFDAEGTLIEKTLSGWEAQVFQHEFDHLQGTAEKIVPYDFRTVRNTEPKLGRNNPCPNGCGKKVKRCSCETVKTTPS